MVNDAIWNDGDLYGTVITPTSFVAPPDHSTDTLYNFMMSGLNGQRSISEAAPGDGSGNIAVELTSDEELFYHVDEGHIELVPTAMYFECPMLPASR